MLADVVPNKNLEVQRIALVCLQASVNFGITTIFIMVAPGMIGPLGRLAFPFDVSVFAHTGALYGTYEAFRYKVSRNSLFE